MDDAVVERARELVGRIPISAVPGKTYAERSENAALILAALSVPAEPVAWMYVGPDGGVAIHTVRMHPGDYPYSVETPLYAAPLSGAGVDAARLKSLLDGRDDFIVARGLWSDFCDSLHSAQKDQGHE